VAGLLGGLGAVLFAIFSVATERPPKAKRSPEEDARFFRSLARTARREAVQRWRPDTREPHSTLDLGASSRNDRASEKDNDSRRTEIGRRRRFPRNDRPGSTD